MHNRSAIAFRVAVIGMPEPRIQSGAVTSQGFKRGAAVLGFVASLLLLLATASPAIGSTTDALRLGRAQSPVLDRLDAKLNVDETRRGEANTTDPSKYDMLIVDGDANSRKLLSSSPLLDRFTDAGDPIIALDVKAAEREALFRYTDFEAGTGTPGGAGYQRSELFMYEIGINRGTPTTQIIDSGPLQPSGKDVGDRRAEELRHDYAGELANDAARLIDGGELSKLRAPAIQSPSSAPCDPSPCPELQDWHIEYETPGAPRALPNGNYTGEGHHCWYSIKCPTPGQQASNWTLVHNFDIYLQNKPGQPERQIVEWTLEGQYSPTNPLPTQTRGDFFNMGKNFHLKYLNKDTPLERAWWTGYADVGVRPTPKEVRNLVRSSENRLSSSVVSYPETNSRLLWKVGYPPTTNNLTSYTSGGDSYNIGVNGGISKDGPTLGGGFTYNVQYPSQTTNDPDWGVQNLTAGNYVNWRFNARNACNVANYGGGTDSSNTGCWDPFKSPGLFGGVTVGYTPKFPNETSRGQTEIKARARWETRSLVKPADPDLAFMIDTPVGVADIYCDPGSGVTFDLGSTCPKGGSLREAQGGPDPLRINDQIGILQTTGGMMVKFAAGNVIPVGIQDFSVPDKADASKDKTVTAKVTLKKPAPLPVDVVVYSDDSHAQANTPGANFPASRGVIQIDKGCRGAGDPDPKCQDKSPGTLDINLKPPSAGKSATALISAVYGDVKTNRLEIVNPKAP